MDDIPLLITARNSNTREMIEDRISKKHVGLCAHEGKIVCYTWAGSGENIIPDHEIVVNFPPYCKYSYDSFTNPKFRRLGIFGELIDVAKEIYLDHGFTYNISVVDVNNEASLKASIKNGSKISAVLKTSRILGMVSQKLEIKSEDESKLIKSIFNFKK